MLKSTEYMKPGKYDLFCSVRVRVQVWTSIDLLTGTGLEHWLFMQILERNSDQCL